ncbi:DUF2071 domain-containing protein [Flavobacterium sp. NST-5]|uniref:DUF2071 domain-containing protein n=1 Tax=Flavobacterium ichthyis TaxID=2698827 RepID=A0ABW9Z7D2_9FLAO|nr:DUF2071 domain-containing protein [Flavobacterium ichthyis]NBL64787.1 DUF2071 domain-containing protein [Flavobacterium ichthyis]
MKIKQILQQSDHRPWEIPQSPWRFYQEWNDAIFLHWEVELEALQKFVPKELEIDLFEGKAWVSVVAFAMEEIRPRFLPAFGAVSNFFEINIRTYVKRKNKTGVYFLSMEGGKDISCRVAKFISELPYRFSKIERTMEYYRSSNKVFKDRLDIKFKVGETVEKTPLDIWLTERYALFQDAGNYINEYEIHHQEWPLKEAVIENLELHYPRFEKLFGSKPNLCGYSPGVKVVAWGKKKIGKDLWHL